MENVNSNLPDRRSGRGQRVVDAVLRDTSAGVAIAVWLVVGICVAVVAALKIQPPSIHLFQSTYFINAVLVVLVIELAAGIVFLAISRQLEVSIRIAVGMTMVVLWWSTFASMAEYVPLPYAASVFPVVIGAVLAYASIKSGRAVGVMMLIAVFVGFAVVMGGSFLRTSSTVNQPVGSVVDTVGSPDSLPNLLVVVLDGYASHDTLRTVYSVSNDQFLQDLVAEGFAVNEQARSNYNRTYASVSSLLSLETLVTPDGDTALELAEVRGVGGGDGEFLRAFERAGYEIAMAPAIWPGSFCGRIVDRCVESGVTRNNLYWLMRLSLLSPVAQNFMRHPWTDTSWDRASNIASIFLESKPEKPTVTWVHLALPHPPVAVSSDCTVHSERWRNVLDLTDGSSEDERRIAAFGDQTGCLNAVMIDQIRTILEADKEAAILLVSDHGPDGLRQPTTPLEQYSPQQIHEKFGILAAFRGPQRCQDATDRSTLVEIGRDVVRCMLDASIVDTSPEIFLVPREVQIGNGGKPQRLPPGTFP
jgi:hypothetical protein